jgi:hypothetical protein
MSDGTKIGPLTAKGRVFNGSKEWLWVLFDQNNVVTAKYLAPGFKSPKGIDADALKAWRSGMTIDGYTSWWKFPSVASAWVSDNLFSAGLGVAGSIPFVLSKTKESDWGDIHYDLSDLNWGSEITWTDYM